MLFRSIVDALTPRVRKRVDAYLADDVQVGVQTLFGQSTVRIAEVDVLCDEDEIVCDCLLAPRCAHRAVVALSLELADGTEAEEERGAVLGVAVDAAIERGETLGGSDAGGPGSPSASATKTPSTSGAKAPGAGRAKTPGTNADRR